MIIKRSFSEKELDKIAMLHMQAIPTGFLSQLRENFLKNLYAFIEIDTGSFLIAAVDNDKVIGFVSGTKDIKNLYLSFLKKNFFKSIFLILPLLFKISNIKKIFETLLIPFKNKPSNREIRQYPTAELLAICINEKYRRNGIAERLYFNLVEDFKKYDIHEFKVVVGKELSGAQNFYRKMGAVVIDEKEIHKGIASSIFLHSIKD